MDHCSENPSARKVIYTGTIPKCKHGKIDQKNVIVYQNYSFFGQMPKNGSKLFFNLEIFMVLTIIVLSTQI